MFGTSAKYLALAREGRPGARHGPTTSPRSAPMLSTGSPLAAHSFDYVYRAIKRDVHLASISGGTDIISCFALGNPIGPVWRGELQMRGLGMAVEVFDAGRPAQSAAREGELVCTRPFPSMPVAFWDDPDGSKYRAAYFERVSRRLAPRRLGRLTEHDGLVILGRSDATLNPGRRAHRDGGDLSPGGAAARGRREPGRRAGVGGGRAHRAVRRLRDGLTLDDALRERIRRADPGAREPSPRAHARSCRWPTSPARSAARSPSSPCGTWCTAGP